MKTKFLLFAFAISAFTSIIWAQTPLAPTITVINAASGGMSITFTAGSDGGSAITGYKYSTDNGVNWVAKAAVGSTISITTQSTSGTPAFVGGTTYSVAIKAVNANGDGTASGIVSQTYISLSGGGNGTSGNTFKIATANEVNNVKSTINLAAGTGPAATAYYTLTADIDCSTLSSGLFYGGIGNSATNVFKGNFDGAGHKVYGLVAASATPASATNRLSSATTGFFSYLGAGATISNLWVDVAYYLTSAGAANSGPTCGGIVGYISGNATINNCKVTGIIDVESTGATANSRSSAGGIVGNPNSSATVTIINSTVNATIIARSNTTVAGIAMSAGIVGEIKNSTQTVNIVNCSASGSVSALSSLGNCYAGGIVSCYSATTATVNVLNCLATNTVSTSGVSASGYNGTPAAGIGQVPTSTSQIKYCMALNPSISGVNTVASTGVQSLNRIVSTTIYPTTGNLDFNYARADMTVQGTVNSVGPTAVTLSKGTTTKDGADLSGTPSSDAITKLNAYVAANGTYNSVTVDSWATLSLTSSSVAYNGSAQAAIVTASVGGTVSNIKYNGSATVPTTVGSYPITADFTPTYGTAYNMLTALPVGTFTITKATPTLSLSATSVTYNGSAQAATVTASVAGATPGNILYNGSATVPTNAGSYTITADFTPTDGTNYNSLTGASAGTFTINPATPTVSVTVGGTYTYNNSPQGPNAATNTGTGSSYTYIYSNSGTSTPPTAAGSYTVTATVAADGNYGSASSSATAFSIEKATQTINFGAFPTGKLTGDLDFPPGATSATSGTNAITYTTSNSAVASISGIGEIHIVGVGTCTIYADQASSTNYNAATQASQSLTIAARPVLIMGSNATAADLTNDVADISVPASADLTIGATRTIHNITIERGGKVTLNDGYSLTVNDFNINSDASGTGTFVDMNTTNAHGLTVNGATNVQQYLSSSRNWYMSSPVSGASSLPTVDGVGSLTFYSYPESDSRQAAGVNGVYAAGAVWNTVSGATTMAFGTGYIVKPSAATSTVTFSGTGLNTGNQTISGLTYTAANPKHGFNLIGNPYPSYLNVLPSISSNVDGLEPTVWYRTRDAAGYYHCETVNTSDGFGTNSSLTGRVTGYIPPMQGFWVRTKLNNQSIALSNSNRSHTTSVTMSGIGTVPTTPLKSPTLKNETYGLLGLNVFNGITGDETIIKFYSGATNNLDAYDSGKMSNGNVNIPELFTIVDGSQLAINTMNSIPYDTEIALGFTTGKSGDFTINASLMSNFAEGTQILLKDNIDPQNPVITDLAKQSYSFNSDTTTSNTSRFTLIFKAPSVATVINPESKGNVWISIRNGQIVVNGTANRVMLEVFNSVGQKVISKNLGTTNMLLNNNLAAGAYLVKLTTEGKSITRKIIID